MNAIVAPVRELMANGMAKSRPKLLALLVGGALLAGMLIFLAVQSMPVVGWLLWALAIAAVGALASLWYQTEIDKARQAETDIRTATQRKESEKSRAELRRQRGLRRTELLAKYANDESLVERIVLGSFWEGQTAGQLKDALGNPADIAAKVLKGKRQEIWKYHPVGGDRYALWITLAEDCVVRWEERA